jgi:CubicO group peptidase (beta-lactamase class C family)
MEDRWHIGSCTKSMTATLLARYVERGEASWVDTVAGLLPELASGMHAEARAITLGQLLTATAGLPEFPSFAESEDEIIADIYRIAADAPTPQEQRLLAAERILSRAPLTPPGTAYAYSSAGFIIVGAIAERIGGAPYEQLLAHEVFDPLAIRAFGFGAPGNADAISQPRGHADSAPDTPLAPDNEEADNPAYFAPAGGLNISLGDWAKYAFDHAAGESGGGRLLRADTYSRLHTPGVEGGQYAFGWGMLVRDGLHALLTHNGSNGAWFADIRVYPPSGYVYLMATNDGREDVAKQAFRQVRDWLDEQYQPL